MIKYVTCTVAGVAIGYYIAQVRLQDSVEQQVEDRVEAETEAIREYYQKKYRRDVIKETVSPELVEAANEAAEALLQYQGVKVGPDVLAQEMERVTELVDEDDQDPSDEGSGEADEAVEDVDPDYVYEGGSWSDVRGDAAKTETDDVKSPAGPVNYNAISTPVKSSEDDEDQTLIESDGTPSRELITQNEFIHSKTDYGQASFVYYEGDDVLVDEKLKRVAPEARMIMIGNEAIEILKRTRKDVYIRNHTGRWEFDLALDEGKFSDLVLD